MIGQTIAHYQILGKIGEGGMGVVYRARDTHLDRFVAIKLLPPESVADAERKRRFIQEARTASSLNHPNIITVHDIASYGETDFMVMEFVAGKALNQLIGRKGLKLHDALNYGTQIANALAAAHAAGIVHRDLKPGNVMITESGLVKVLDFGLAKLMEPAMGDLSRTQTMKPQTEGFIVGTAAYMSPEQAQGEKLDPRSDVFSFGSVLYEMITGRRAFAGDNMPSIIAAVLQREPVPARQIAPDVPRDVERIIELCLRKDRARRLQHMDDVKLQLGVLQEEMDSGRLAATPTVTVRHRSRWIMTVTAATVVAVVFSCWWFWPAKPAAPLLLRRLTYDSGLTTNPALSPDGRLLAYASDRAGQNNLDIWVRQVGGGEPIQLTKGPADEREPSFSPDGTRVAFRSEAEGGGIYVVPALGGSARLLVAAGRRPRFSPDGNWIAYWTGVIGGGAGHSMTWVVPAVGGAPRQIQPDLAACGYPEWTPDGQALLAVCNGAPGIDWYWLPLDGQRPVPTGALAITKTYQLTGTLRLPLWALVTPVLSSQNDFAVFSALRGDNMNLWKITLRRNDWKARGEPRQLTSGTTMDDEPSLAAGPDGAIRVAFASLVENTDIWNIGITANDTKPDGPPQRLTNTASSEHFPSLSSDGSKLIFNSNRSGRWDVWMKDLATGEELPVTSGIDAACPRLSPDASRLVYAIRDNVGQVVALRGGSPETVYDGCGWPTSWSRDNRYLLTGGALGTKVWLVDVPARRQFWYLGQSSKPVAQANFSPDGRWIAFYSGNVGRSRVWVTRFVSVSAERADAPAGPTESEWSPVTDEETWVDKIKWSPDGNMLYFTSDRDGYRCIWAQKLEPATKRPTGPSAPVFHSHGARQSMLNVDTSMLEISVARGKLAFTMSERTGNIWMTEWKER